MSKGSRFRGPIDNKQAKRAQARFKSAPLLLYHIYRSL